MTEPSPSAGLQGRPFAVADSVYCWWDVDHRSRTLEFLDGIDSDYFASIAGLLADELESDRAPAASIALRVTYFQGVETLLALLGAAAQGPSVVPAWIAKAGTQDLQETVTRLQRGSPLLTELGTEAVSLDELAKDVCGLAWPDEQGSDSTAVQFGRLWQRVAHEFLDQTKRDEYNALKHGNRVSPGGFSLAIGLESVPGVAAPSENMRSIGGSRFGSSFFVAEKAAEKKWHVRMRRTSLNWDPVQLAHRLVLISMSIHNVVEALRISHGVDPLQTTFKRPDPPSVFDEAWAARSAPRGFNVDVVFELDPADEVSRDDLRAALEDGA